MQDQPNPSEILGAVARFLKDVVVAETKGHVSFNVRVAANALEMMRRQLETQGEAEARELASLKTILGRDGELAELNAEFARRLGEGELTLASPGVSDHLWSTTLAKLYVDQPTYWGYRAALAERTAPAATTP